jgi:hypothetical protein
MCVESARHRPSRSKRSAPRSYAKHHQPGRHRAKAAGAARRGAGASRIVCRPGPATSHGLKLLSLHRIASAACNSFHLVTRGKCITARRHGNGAAAAPSRAESTGAETNTGYALWLSDLNPHVSSRFWHSCGQLVSE